MCKRPLFLYRIIYVQFCASVSTQTGKSFIHVWSSLIRVRGRVHVWGFSHTCMDQRPFFLIPRAFQSRATLKYVEIFSLPSMYSYFVSARTHTNTITPSNRTCPVIQKMTRHVRTQSHRVTIRVRSF